MSTVPPGSHLRLVVVTRDSSGDVIQLRLLGVPTAWALPRIQLAPDEDWQAAVRRAAVDVLGGDDADLGEVVVERIAAVPGEFAVLLDDPDTDALLPRVALLDLPVLGVGTAHAMTLGDLQAIRHVIAADHLRRGRSDDALRERLQPSYEAVARRNVTHNSLMWQVPGLSLTAQAFLLTLALGADTRPAPRIVAALIALVLSIASVQLLRKHSHHELVDRRILERTELLAGWPATHGIPPSSGSRFVDYPSRTLWSAALWVFAAAAIAVILAVGLDAADFTHVFEREPAGWFTNSVPAPDDLP